ncbi:MAG: hypothetical protein ACRD29_02065 [Acidimicrobiales bacterium]
MIAHRRARIVPAPAAAWIAAALAVAAAIALFAAAIALAHDPSTVEDGGPFLRGESPAFFAATVGVVGLLLLVAAVGLGASGLVGVAVGALLAGWVIALAGAGPVVRVDYALGGAAHLAVAEIALWSIERRREPTPIGGRLLAVRGLEMVAPLLATVAGGWALVGLVAGVRGGVALDLAAVLAVVGFGVAVAVLCRRHPHEPNLRP